MFIVTSSAETAHPPLLIVQRKVTDAPIVNPVKPDVGDVGLVMVAVPDTTVHKPVPTVGVLPAKVAVVTLHKF